MDIATAFDAKEYHAGLFVDFFAPIGLGVSVVNYNKFKVEYTKLWRDIFEDKSLEQQRMVYCSRDLSTLYPEKKELLEEAFIEGIRSYLIETNFFFTILPKDKIIYSRGWDKQLPAHEFMKKNVNSYSYLCAWRYSKNSPPISAYLLDEFQGEETNAWWDLTKLRPKIYYRGDMSNPLISTADMVLDFLDYDLRAKKLRDDVIRDELRKVGLSGDKQYIGIPHFREIVPISTNQIDKEHFRARPVCYLIFEDRPKLMETEEWTQTKVYSNMTSFAIKTAFEKEGCVKIYDPYSDYKFLSRNDVFIWNGNRGKEIVNGVGNANGVKSIYYEGQEGV
jgi:hypothetical protein